MDPSEQVRQAAMKGLRNFFRRQGEVVNTILDSIELYGVNRTLSLASYIKCFKPSAEEAKRIAVIYTNADPEKDPKNKNLRFYLEGALCEIDREILEECRSAFLFNRDLRKGYNKALSCAAVRSSTEDQLWIKLVEHSQRSDGYAYTPTAIRQSRNLIAGLVAHGDSIAHKIVMNLCRDKTWNDILEEYLVEIAGEMRLASAARCILNIYQRSNPERTVHGRCIKALGLIGGRELVSKLEWIYTRNQNDRLYISEIFSLIPEPYVVETILRLIEGEKDRGYTGLLIYSLCNIFSLDGLLKARSLLDSDGEGRLIKDMSTAFQNVFAYHKYIDRQTDPGHTGERDINPSLPDTPSRILH